MTGPDPGATRARRDIAMAGHRGDADAARAGLDATDAGVRATALGALLRAGALGEDDLRAALADPAPKVKARAAELAHRFGAALAAPLVELLDHDRRPEVVEPVCFGLGEMGDAVRGDGPVIRALAAVAADHSDALCREAAVAALGAIGDPGGRPAVLAAMADKPAVRRRAVLALAAFDGPEVDAALEQALQDRDWQVRQAAEDLTGHRPDA